MRCSCARAMTLSSALSVSVPFWRRPRISSSWRGLWQHPRRSSGLRGMRCCAAAGEPARRSAAERVPRHERPDPASRGSAAGYGPAGDGGPGRRGAATAERSRAGRVRLCARVLLRSRASPGSDADALRDRAGLGRGGRRIVVAAGASRSTSSTGSTSPRPTWSPTPSSRACAACSPSTGRSIACNRSPGSSLSSPQRSNSRSM